MPTSKETRVRFEGFWKTIASVMPRRGRKGMRDLWRPFSLIASSRMRLVSSGLNSARVGQSRPERGEGGCFRVPGSRAQRYLGFVLGARHRKDAASKKVEGVPDLGPAHRERRREADGAAADKVDEQPVLEAVLEDPRCYFRPELQPDQEPLPAHLRAGHLLCELLECVLENLALEPNLV